MKKLFTLALVFIMAIACITAVGCNKEQKPCSTHSYDSTGKCTVCQEVCVHETYENGVCAECGVACVHTGGTATCVAKKVCDTCGVSYGEVDATNHAESLAWENTASTHKQYYPCCDVVVVAEAAHTYEDGVCSVCEEPCAHASFTDEVCDVCGQPCAHDNYTDGVCICGKECVEHEFEEGACLICGSAQMLYVKTSSLLTSEVVDGEVVYTFTKNAGEGMNSSYETGYAPGCLYIKNVEERQLISFDFYSENFNYFQLCSGEGGTAYWEFDVYNRVQIVRQDTGALVEFNDPQVEGGIWTGEVLPTSTWMTVFVDVSGVEDLGFIFWASAAGTAKIKNIDYVDFGTSKMSNVQFGLDAEGNMIINLIKASMITCNQYGENGFWFDIPEGKTQLVFDIMSPSFNYIQLMAGDEIGYYDTPFSRVSIVNKETGEAVEIAEEIWTGEILELNVWYTFTVDVSEMADLGIMYWQTAEGTAVIANIQYN